MGVMQCDRNDCKEICCDRLICNGRFYICWRCFEALEHAQKSWPENLSESDMIERIALFMATPTNGGREVPIEDPEEADRVWRRLTCQQES